MIIIGCNFVFVIRKRFLFRGKWFFIIRKWFCENIKFMLLFFFKNKVVIARILKTKTRINQNGRKYTEGGVQLKI